MAAELRNISEVVALLQPEFPELTPSSLRFLEKEGLLHPQRTRGAHRLYSPDDIARIRLIKRLQSQRYYPLDLIRTLLTKLERARDREAEMGFLESIYCPLAYDPDFTPLDREQLAARVGLGVSDVARLQEMGLLFPHTAGDGRPRYDEDDLKAAELAAEELRLGAQVGDFAPYAAAMRALVHQEFILFRKLRGETKPTPERVRQLKQTGDLMHALLRAKLTRQMLMLIKHGEQLGALDAPGSGGGEVDMGGEKGSGG